MQRLSSLLLAFLALLLWSPVGRAQEANPFSVSLREPSIPAGSSGELLVHLEVPSGYHVFRDTLELRVTDPGPFEAGTPRFPKGVVKYDAALQKDREQYEQPVDLVVPLRVPASVSPGTHELRLHVRYQGCKDTLCFMPQDEDHVARVRVLPAAPAGGSQGATAPAPAGAGQAAPGPGQGPALDLSIFGQKPPLDDQNPVAVRAVGGEPGELLVGFFLADGWHLNRDLTSLSLSPDSLRVLGEQWPQPQLRVDPNTGSTRRELVSDFLVRVRVAGPEGQQHVQVTASYQACKEELCLMPQDVVLPVDLRLAGEAGPALSPSPAPAQAATGSSPSPAPAQAATGSQAAPAQAAPAAQESSASPSQGGAGVGQDTFARMQSKGLFWLVLSVFGAGFLVSLTPCVLPMIPITMGIIGARAAGSRLKAFLISLSYVAGLALVYTALGVFAALTGSIFGAWMQSPWVVGAVSLFFVAMAFSMFGFFDVAVPSSVATKLNQLGGSGFVGAFVVGMVGALVAGPCSGPVVAGLMVLVGQQGQVLLGAFLMLAFSLGMGVLFLLAGTFSSVVIRPGAWMETVKQAFGVIMLLGAIYFSSAHLPDTVVALLTAGVLLATAVYGWPSREKEEEEGFWVARSKRLYAVVALLVGSWLLLATMATRGFILPPLSLATGSSAASHEQGIAWLADEAQAVERARAEGKPLLLDFTADWCAACHELEKFTYSDPEVVALSRSFVPVMVDATSSDDPRVKELLEKYGVKGLPTVAFVLPDGSRLDELTVTGFVKAPEFLQRMRAALERVR